MITAEQRERIRAIIENGAESQFCYRDVNGKTCVLGGLAVAAQIPLPALGDNGAGINTLYSFRAALAAEFGLSDRELAFLQDVNDRFYSVSERRSNLYMALETM